LVSEHALTALSNCQATGAAGGTEVAFARENQGDHHSGAVQGQGAGVRNP
jgi:hypothetical protein